MVGGVSVSRTSLVSVSSSTPPSAAGVPSSVSLSLSSVSSACSGAGGVDQREYAGAAGRNPDEVRLCVGKDHLPPARDVDPDLRTDRRLDASVRVEEERNEAECREETPLFSQIASMDGDGDQRERLPFQSSLSRTVGDVAVCCPPSYLEAVGASGGLEDRSVPPPSYESLFCEGGTVRIICESGDVGGRATAASVSSSEHERRPRRVGDPVFPEEIDRQSVLDALNREFRWTAMSVGFSIILLFVFVLIIVLVIAPYNRH